MRRRAVLIKSSSRLGVMREHPHQIAGGNDAWRFAFGQRRGATRRLGRDIDAGGLGLCAQRADGQILALVMLEHVEAEEAHRIAMRDIIALRVGQVLYVRLPTFRTFWPQSVGVWQVPPL